MSQDSDDFVEFQALAEFDDVIDEAATDDSVVPAQYDITSLEHLIYRPKSTNCSSEKDWRSLLALR